MTNQQMTLLVLAGVGVAVVAVLLLSNAQPAPARQAMTVKRTFTPMTSYQNAEEWEFKRDPRSGFITDIRVHRDARVGRAA